VKTISLKKVSAVAVASLGFGLLSVAPANAADLAMSTSSVASISLAKVTTTPTVGAAVAVNWGADTTAETPGSGDKAKGSITAYLKAFPAGGSVAITPETTLNGDGATASTAIANTTKAVVGASITLISTSAATATFGTDVTASSSAGFGSFKFTPTKVGTYTLEVWNDADQDGVIDATETRQSIDLTVVAAAGLSAGTSSALIISGNGTTAPGTTSDAKSIAAAKTMAAANVAAIEVISKDTDNADYASVQLSASISGPGYLVWQSAHSAPNANQCSTTPTYSGTVGRSISSQTADALGELYVCAEGTAGTATVTVSLTDTVSKVKTQIGTVKTVTFYDSVAKLELAKSVWTNIRAGGYWQDGADADTEAELQAISATVTQSVTIKLTDSAGRVANSTATPTVVPGNTAVIASGVCGLDDNSSTTYSSGGTGFYNCGFQSATSSKSGDKDTVTIRIVDPADATKYLTVTVNLTIGGSVSSEVMTTDKTSYAPGEAMQVTITAKDSAGNPAYDGAATPSSITASKSAIGLPSAASFYVAGKKTYGSKGDVFAPALPGSFTLTATGTSSAAPTITAASSVTDANAGLMTQIDALNAKIVALNALIAKIMKKLGVK